MRNTSRRVRVGVLIATGIIGFGGVAAAGPGGVFDNGGAANEVATTTTTTEVPGPTTTVAVSVEVSTTVAAATTTTLAATAEVPVAVAEVLAEAVPVPLVDDPETTFDETMCLEGNHGKTVSAVARGELVIPDIDVVDAAHSSCGKQAAAEETEEAEAGEPADIDDEAVDAPAKEKKNGNNGNGQANGRGRGNPHDD